MPKKQKTDDNKPGDILNTEQTSDISEVLDHENIQINSPEDPFSNRDDFRPGLATERVPSRKNNYQSVVHNDEYLDETMNSQRGLATQRADVNQLIHKNIKKNQIVKLDQKIRQRERQSYTSNNQSSPPEDKKLKA